MCAGLGPISTVVPADVPAVNDESSESDSATVIEVDEPPADPASDDGSTCIVPNDPVEVSVPIAEVPDPEPPDVPDPEPPKVHTVSTYVDIPFLTPFPSTSPPAKAQAKAPAKAPASSAARIQAAFDFCLTVSKDHASDSVYVKAFTTIRDRLWRIQIGKVEKMTTPELNSCITNALWEEQREQRSDVVEELLS